MVAIVRLRGLDLAGQEPDEARAAILELLGNEPTATRKVYAAFTHKVWSLLIERRFDEQVRDWHDLLRGVKAKVGASDAAAAERLTALADLLRESISLAQTSPAREVAARPRAKKILDLLTASNGFIARRQLIDQLKIGSSHLSNVMTQLIAHDLVERRGNGKEAQFKATQLGLELTCGGRTRKESDASSLPSMSDLVTRIGAFASKHEVGKEQHMLHDDENASFLIKPSTKKYAGDKILQPADDIMLVYTKHHASKSVDFMPILSARRLSKPYITAR